IDDHPVAGTLRHPDSAQLDMLGRDTGDIHGVDPVHQRAGKRSLHPVDDADLVHTYLEWYPFPTMRSSANPLAVARAQSNTRTETEADAEPRAVASGSGIIFQTSVRKTSAPFAPTTANRAPPRLPTRRAIAAGLLRP